MQLDCLFLYLLPQIRRSIICKYAQLNSCANRKHINIPIIPILFVIVISKMPNIRIVAYSIFERMKEFIFSLTNNDPLLSRQKYAILLYLLISQTQTVYEHLAHKDKYLT